MFLTGLAESDLSTLPQTLSPKSKRNMFEALLNESM